LVAAGPLVTVPGGYPQVPWGGSFGLAVTSPDDARVKTHQLLDEGADLIKIAVESGASFDRTIPTVSPVENTAITEAAHARSTRVSAHVLVAADLAQVVAGDADDIAHMVPDSLSDELIAIMLARGILPKRLTSDRTSVCWGRTALPMCSSWMAIHWRTSGPWTSHSLAIPGSPTHGTTRAPRPSPTHWRMHHTSRLPNHLGTGNNPHCGDEAA
jgi:hypothetical protein